MIDGNGYRYIDEPDWFEGGMLGAKAKEHHIVMCQNMCINKIPEGYVVHHIDENKLNNTCLNLQLITRSKHQRLHNKKRVHTTGWKQQQKAKDAISKAKIDAWANPEYHKKTSEAMRGKRQIVVCPHCGKKGGGGNMRRYHFNNCKYFGSTMAKGR